MDFHYINDTKTSFDNSVKRNINFSQNYQNYTYASKGTYLPRNREVFLEDNVVLALAGNRDGSMQDAYMLGLDNNKIKFLFDYFGFKDITVGRDGDVEVPQENEKVSRRHLQIRKLNGGYLVKDMSTNGTQVTGYKDYTAAQKGTYLPENKEVLINKDAVLKLGNSVLDLNSNAIRRKLDNFVPNITYTIGRNGDIKLNENDVHASRKHLEITKVKDYYVVKDASLNGTQILDPGRNSFFAHANRRTYNYGNQQYQQQRRRRKQERQQQDQYGYQQQQNYSSDNAQETNPKSEKSTPKFDCSEKCQKDLQALFKPFEKLKIGERLSSDERRQMKKMYMMLAIKYHPDNNNGDSKDWLELKKQCTKKGLLNKAGHWIN